MEMYREFEENESDVQIVDTSTESVVKRSRKLSALDKLLGEEVMISEPSLSTELDKYLAEPPTL